MSRVLMINPPWVIGNDNSLWNEISSCWPSLGLAYIASVLLSQGHWVRYLDCSAEHYTVDVTKKKLKEYVPIDYVFITATTPLIKNALLIAKHAKRIYENVKVVLGGVHPSVMPVETLRNSCVDYIVIDEGEETAKELLQEIKPEKILGLGYKKNGKIIINKGRPLIPNLDGIPPPAYHLLPMEKYYPAVGSYRRLPAMSIFATRGCPGRCTFCYRAFRGIVRKRSAENIINEIKLLQKDYGIREICFYDDTFTLFKEEIKKFCQILISEKLDISWSCFTRVDYVDEDLLLLMKKAGCHLILFGVESADKKILQNIKKNISLSQVKRVVKVCRKIGINTRVSFMIGNQGETEKSVIKTINFCLELDPDEVHFNIATPYPGTELFNWAKEKRYIKSYDWNDYTISNVVYELPNMDKKKMEYFYKLAHRKFYFRPKIILRRLFNIRSWTQLMQEVQGAKALFNFVRAKL